MTYGVYAIKDTVVGAFLRPFTHVNDASAIRDFSSTVNDERNDFMKQNHGDMSLYKLGTFDDATGVTTSDVEFICAGASVWKEV